MCFGDMDYRTLRRETEDRVRDVPRAAPREARDWGAILGGWLDGLMPKPAPSPVALKVRTKETPRG